MERGQNFQLGHGESIGIQTEKWRPRQYRGHLRRGLNSTCCPIPLTCLAALLHRADGLLRRVWQGRKAGKM